MCESFPAKILRRKGEKRCLLRFSFARRPKRSAGGRLPMRRGTWTWLCVTIGLAIGVPFCLVVGSVIAGYLYLRGTVEEIDAAEREMQQPAFYQPVVRDLALF